MSKSFYDQYADSVYKKANALTPREFERAALGFAALYQGLLPEQKDAHILDAGCGGGHFLYFLEKNGYSNYEGIDISPGQVALCREQITPRVEVADALEFLDGKPSSYDLIVAHDVLEHFPKEKAVALVQKMFLALRPLGRIIIRVPNMSNPLAAHGRYIDLTHEIGFTERSLYQILFLGGFRRIELKGGMLIRKRSLRSFLRRVFLKVYYAWVRFLYYVQDFSVPRILDHDLIAVGQKTEEGA